MIIGVDPRFPDEYSFCGELAEEHDREKIALNLLLLATAAYEKASKLQSILSRWNYSFVHLIGFEPPITEEKEPLGSINFPKSRLILSVHP